MKVHLLLFTMSLLLIISILLLAIVSLMLILVVFLQKPEDEGTYSSFGSRMNSVMQHQGATDGLEKATKLLASCSLILIFWVSYLVTKKNKTEVSGGLERLELMQDLIDEKESN